MTACRRRWPSKSGPSTVFGPHVGVHPGCRADQPGTDFLEKPVSMDGLLVKVRHVLDR